MLLKLWSCYISRESRLQEPTWLRLTLTMILVGVRSFWEVLGMFEKTWKPKKTRPIRGPVITTDDSVHRKGNHLEQRERLGLTSASKERSHRRTPPPETMNALQKVEVEKAKQDDTFADISNVLGELKDMAIEMGLEFDRQIRTAGDLEGEVDVLNSRVKYSNQRARYLLRK